MVKFFYIISIISALICMTFGERFIETKYHCPKRDYLFYPCQCLKASDIGISISCENTNLASLSLALENLANEKIPIEVLKIDNSQFAVLFGTLFRNLEAWKISISNTPIVEIDEHAFLGVNETLQELEINNSELNRFPKAFKILGKLTSLKLNKHNITQLETNAVADGSVIHKLERLHISNGNISEVPVEFVQLFRKLKTLDLHGNNLMTLKKNQFKNLRELEILDISHNNITKLDSSHIADLTKLGWCNVSHNAINEITRGTFARNSVLRVLNMSQNKIKRLDANSFRGMRFLRRLYLSDNFITDIGRGTFTSITRIGTIDLARNRIKKVDFQMFAQLNYVEIIDLAENSITEIQKQSFKDLYLANVNISHNLIEKFESNAFENCVNMTFLDLSHNKINSFAKQTFDDLSYATVFLLSHNLLTNFSAVPLYNMTGLKILDVSHNEIIEIPKNTFPKLYELHTIDMSYNNLSIIYNAVFQTLFSVRNINFSYNHLESIKAQTFGAVPTILEMDLSNNRLNEIARGAFTKLISLRILHLENNQLEKIFQIPLSLNSLLIRNNRIKEIAPRTWPSMNALLEIDLENNLLENRLTGESFTGLLTTRHLNLNNNGISRIPKESLGVLSTLQYLYLESNNITEIPSGAFGKLPVVFELHLRNNQISNISSFAFDGLLQLLKLDMSSNQIKTIPTDAFTGLVSLRQLDLSFNQLRKLDNKTNGVIDDCLSLESINLSHNRFSFITKKTFPSNQYIPYRLREIDLSYNEMPVLTYDLSFGTNKVKLLNISHNHINEIRRNVLSNLTNLETLDMSHNEIKDLLSEQFNFTFPKNLTKLYINNNQLNAFPMQTIKNVSNFQLIDLRNNSIETFNISLLNSVRNGLELHITGNPIDCDCTIRPLKHYINSLISVPSNFMNIQCESPDIHHGKLLHTLPDDNLNCVPSKNTSAKELAILPDLSFREIYFSKGNLSVQWTLLVTNNDVAGFYLIIRNSENEILVEHHVSYEKRWDQFTGNEICQDDCSQLELCVQTKNSFKKLNGWFDSQCVYLPKNFEKIKRKYTVDSSQINIIHSIRRNISAKTSNDGALTSNQRMLSENGFYIVIMAVIYTTIYWYLQ